MQAELHPVELREHVVGEVEPAVAADVDLDASEHAKRREALVGVLRSPPLAAERVGVEPGHDADVRRVVADREVLVAALACGAPISSTEALPSDQVVWQWRSPRTSASSSERRRRAPKGLLAKLRRAPGHAECGVHAGLVLGGGQRPSAST